MAMGRRNRTRQEELWIPHFELASTAAHPFYRKLNGILEDEGFDQFVEQECSQYYAAMIGRPSIAPGVYFRCLFTGYFEGIGSERGIAWRTADSLALREFLGVKLTERPPDHSSLSRTRRLISVETHQKVFDWVLAVVAKRGLVVGKRIGVDATSLEANAAMRSIVRRDNGQSYDEFLKQLAKESGMETPTREDLARLDRKRNKTASNKDWVNPHDDDARVTKMKDGSTHLAHKAEHAVDMDSGAILAVTLNKADQGDTATITNTVAKAGEAAGNLAGMGWVNEAGIEELVADKGYHSAKTLKNLKDAQVRTYIPERKQNGKRRWAGKQEEREAVYANRRRIKRAYGKKLLKKRGELIERSFTHCYDTGGMRRTHLRGHNNILKRQLVHVGAFNLSLILRKLLGVGKPRRLQGLTVEGFLRLFAIFRALWGFHAAF